MTWNRSFAMTRALSIPEKRAHFTICVIADELNVVMIKGTLMLSKRELIRFVCTKNHIFNPPTIKLKELIAQI
jgi:hypothetical protein